MHEIEKTLYCLVMFLLPCKNVCIYSHVYTHVPAYALCVKGVHNLLGEKLKRHARKHTHSHTRAHTYAYICIYIYRQTCHMYIINKYVYIYIKYIYLFKFKLSCVTLQETRPTCTISSPKKDQFKKHIMQPACWRVHAAAVTPNFTMRASEVEVS